MEDDLSAEEIENKLKKLQTVLQVWLNVKREDEGERVDTQLNSDDEHEQKIKTFSEKREALMEATDYLARRKEYLRAEKEYLRDFKQYLREKRQYLSEERQYLIEQKNQLRAKCLQSRTQLTILNSKLNKSSKQFSF